MNIERRYLLDPALECRAAPDGAMPQIVGYASVFDSESEDLGGFREIVKPGAFRSSLDSGADIRATVNHDEGQLLGRRKSGTLNVYEDERGLRFELTPPDTSYARDLLASMKRGDITGASFGFLPPLQGRADAWRNAGGQKIRELRNVRLFEVSIVSVPAYTEAGAALRSLQAHDREALATARRRLIARSTLP